MNRLVFFVLLVATALSAADKSPVTVKSSQVVSGVVLVRLMKTESHLICNAMMAMHIAKR